MVCKPRTLVESEEDNDDKTKFEKYVAKNVDTYVKEKYVSELAKS